MNLLPPIYKYTALGPEFSLRLTPSIINYNDYSYIEYNV